MGAPNGNGNATIDAWLSRYAETKAGQAAAGWGALLVSGEHRRELWGVPDQPSPHRQRAGHQLDRLERRAADLS
jgi:hypothetical protein